LCLQKDRELEQSLAGFPERLEAHYAAIPAEFKHWAPPSWEGVPSEPFTAIEQICHIRDIEVDGYHVRFRRMLDEINPTLVSIDSEALAKARSYGTSSAAEAFDVFRKARAETVQSILPKTSYATARRPLRSEAQSMRRLQWQTAGAGVSKAPGGLDEYPWVMARRIQVKV
jgi:hypothetical protein